MEGKSKMEVKQRRVSGLPEVAALASQVDCFTEQDVATLAGVKITTLEAWRKRGMGPEYALFGCHYLYPRSSTAMYLTSLVRARAPVQGKSHL